MKRLRVRLFVGVAALACVATAFVLWRDRPRSYADDPGQPDGTAKWRSVGSPYAGKTQYYSDGSSADTKNGKRGSESPSTQSGNTP